MEVLADRENTTAMNVAELTEQVSGGDVGGERHDALIGSSLVRDVDGRKLVNTAVTCKPGGRTADVTRQVATLTEKSLNGITLVSGYQTGEASERHHHRLSISNRQRSAVK